MNFDQYQKRAGDFALAEENPRIVTDHFKKTIYEMYRTGVDLKDKFIELSFAMGGPKGITKEEVK